TKRPFNSKWNQKPLHSKHAPPPAKLPLPPRNVILRSAKHVPLLANPKPKAPNLKPSGVTKSDQVDSSGSEEGDGSGSEEEGDEEEDGKKVDGEEDEEEGDEEEDEKDDYEEEEEKVSEEEEEEDVNVKRNKRGGKGKGEVVMSKGKKIKFEYKEVGEKKERRILSRLLPKMKNP
nr:hypothetical protein [Tanacetum cinerariifolium]